MGATREACSICGRISRIGFHVPDEIWRHVIHPHYQNSIVCLACFAERADEHFIEWDKQIEFHPVSFKTHLEMIRPKLATKPFKDYELEAIKDALIECRFKNIAAKKLGISERTLFRKIKQYHLE
jgi:transcriptional regulator with PAS, ATPase and Fis domain